MLLPYAETVWKLFGISLEKAVFRKISGVNGRWKVTLKTLTNWKSRKHRPQDSKVHGLDHGVADSIASVLGATPEQKQKILETLRSLSEQPDKKFYLDGWNELDRWNEVYLVAVAAYPILPLVFHEMKRLVDASYELREARDLSALAAALERLDFPKTKIVRNAIERLGTQNDTSGEAVGIASAPLRYSNLLYLMVCWDIDIGLLDGILPVFYDDGEIQLPFARWMDAVKKENNFSDDAALGKFLFPEQLTLNCEREMLKWRKIPPSWRQIRNRAEAIAKSDASFNKSKFFEKLAFALFTHNICLLMIYFDGELCCRELFESVPQLKEYARERQQARALSTS